MTAVIKDGEILILTSSGVERLRISAALTKAIGGKCKTSADGIRIPIACVDILLNLYPSVLSEELEKVHAEILWHKNAVNEANEILSSASIVRITPYWGDVLDIPQQCAVAALTSPGLMGACLFDEQGTGKTVMSIAAFDILKDTDVVDNLIVIAPMSMLGGWKKDFETFLKDKYSLEIITGTAIERRAAVNKRPDVLVVNYEGVESVLVLLQATARSSRTMIVVDESYYAKNSAAIRSLNLLKLRPLCKKGLVLCGTPAPATPYDLINQVDLADNGFAFATFGKSKNLDDDKSTIKNILANRAVAIRRLKTEVLSDVPEKNFELVRIKLEGQQRAMYDKAKNDLLVELKSLDNKTFKKNLTSYFQKRLALLEICAVPKMLDPLYASESAKIIRLIALVDKLVAENRKVLIWTLYKLSIDEIKSALNKYNPLVIDGSVSGEERTQCVRKFQEDSTYMVMIANPAAAGAGITLHAAYDAIYFSYTNQAAHYLQSLDRIHRRGQKAKCVNYFMFICENTIEEHEVKRLRQKELNQHELLGDSISWPESLDQALEELVDD